MLFVCLSKRCQFITESAQLGDSMIENFYEDSGAELEESNVRRFGT